MNLRETAERAANKAYQDIYLKPQVVGVISISPEIRMQASELISSGARYRECIALLDGQENTPSDPTALRIRGAAKVLGKDYASAQADFAAAQNLLQRELSIVHCNQAASSLEESMEKGNIKVDEAIEHACQALQYDPKWYLPYVNLGSAYLAKGDTAATWELFEKMLALWPDGRDDKNLRAHVLATDGFWSVLRATPDFTSKINKYLAPTNQ